MIRASEQFHAIANGSVRPLDWDCNISFTKERDNNRNWFILNESTLDGGDLLSMNEDQSIQLWDFYKYDNYKDRLLSMSITRSIKFPYSVQSAIADITLDNHDNWFTQGGIKYAKQLDSIEGDASQYQDKRGKNLLVLQYGITNAGLTHAVGEDGEITTNGTSTATYSNIYNRMWLKEPLEAGDYCFSRSRIIKSDNGDKPALNIRLYYEDGTYFDHRMLATDAYVNITTTKRILSMYCWYGSLASGWKFTNQKTKLMLTKGHAKNLLPTTSTQAGTVSSGVTVTREPDGSITLNGTATATSAFHINYCNRLTPQLSAYDGRQVTMSITTSGTGAYSNIGLKQGTSTNICVVDSARSITGTYTFSNYDNITCDIWFNTNLLPITFENYNIKVQLEYGATATEFTPYHDIAPSTYTRVEAPKNYFGVDMLSSSFKSNESNTWEILDEDSFKITSALSSGYNYRVVPITNFRELLGKTITISADVETSGDFDTTFCVYSANTANKSIGTSYSPNFEMRNGRHSVTVALPTSLPSGSDCIALLVYSCRATMDAGVYAIFRNVQIEISNFETDYERYKKFLLPSASNPVEVNTITGNTAISVNEKQFSSLNLGDVELVKLGDVYDKIYKQNGRYYLAKRTGKLKLDSTQGWYVSGKAIKCLWTSLGIDNIARTYQQSSYESLAYCNYGRQYCYVEFQNAYSFVEGGFGLCTAYISGDLTNATNALYFRYAGMTDSLAQFKTFVDAHDVYVYYELRDEVITEIEPQSALYEQLSALDIKLKELNGSVNFRLNATVNSLNGVVNSTSEDVEVPLSDYILPARPMRLYMGFKNVENLPQFVGLTEQVPSYTGINNNTAQITAMDFLSSIGDMTLQSSLMMRDVRTDEAIEMILQQFGLDTSMYELDMGSNVIPFLLFEKGKNAGNALSELVLAENGKLWLSETGIIRFSPRVSDLGKMPVMVFNESNIIDYKPSALDGIYNRVKVKSEIRKVQANQPIFSQDNENGYNSENDTYRVKANNSLVVWLTLEDPAWTANVNPTLNGDNTGSHFTALALDGSRVSIGVTATGELFADSIKMTFTNENSFPVSISFLQIWGEPAKVVDNIEYDAYDDESIEKYGEKVLDISDNKFFGSYENVDNFATTILRQRAKYSPDCTIRVKDNPALQIDDIVIVNWKGYDTYKVTSVKRKLSQKGLETELGLERFEILLPFILNESILNGEDRLG